MALYTGGLALGPDTMGSIFYSVGNGPNDTFTFNGGTLTTNFSVTPKYDEAGRTVIYSLFSITLETWLMNNKSSIDLDMNAIIAVLQKSGGVFNYTGHGNALLPTINALNFRDVVWGPKPRIQSMETVGGRATKLTWTIELGLPTCDDASYAFQGMEFNYGLKWAIDYAGFSTRNISGFIRIPQTRLSPLARTLTDSADAYRAKVTPPLLLGFKREQSFDLSYDKCRLDFHITDTQLESPNAYPSGVAQATASQSFSTVTTPAGAVWVLNIDAEYEIIQGFGVIQAISAFQNLLQDRLLQARNMVFGEGLGMLGRGAPINPAKKAAVIPWHFSVAEPSIYGRRMVKFSAGYLVKGTGLSEIMRSGGLWRPTPDVNDPTTKSDFANWQRFMGGVNSCRGYLNLGFALSDDAIVDLCGTNPTITINNIESVSRGPTSITPPNAYGPPTPGPMPPVGPTPGYSSQNSNQYQQSINTYPDPETSWLGCTVTVEVVPDMGTVVGRTLPTTPFDTSSSKSQSQQNGWDVTTGQIPSSANLPPSMWQPAQNLLNQDKETGSTFVQQRVAPSIFLILRMTAMRAGYPIPVPQLINVNGATPTPISGRGDGMRQGIIRNIGVPIYGAEAQLTYVLTSVPKAPVPDVGNAFLS